MLSDTPSAPLILVVEDNPAHAELIERALDEAEEEYRLLTVPTLAEALQAALDQQPDLVLTDYRLPDGEGNQMVAAAGGEWPVILMTSHGNEQVAVEAMKAGAHDYVVKSVEMFNSLSRIVQRSLREWHMLRERREIQEAIHRAKHEWEETFDSVPDMIAIIAPDRTIIRANRAMAERCNCRTDQLIGRKCFEVMHEGTCDPHHCPHARMLEEKREQVQEGVQGTSGDIFDVSVSPLFDQEGNVRACVHVARDVTARKKAEEERLLFEQQFRQAQKLESLGVLSGGIAHDFNNILTIILGHCFLAREEAKHGGNPEEFVAQIESAAQRAADLCRQMLDYAGRSRTASSFINIRIMVDEILKMVTSAIGKKVAIRKELQPDAPTIEGDSGQIQQIVMNLVINASEAIGDREGEIRVTLSRRIVSNAHPEHGFLGEAIPPGLYACLEITDNGCGMDAETSRRIFEPFFTTKFTGRGLGMSATLGIIKSHRGALQLSSTPGVGTRFTVFFPAAGTQAASGTSAPQAVSAAGGSEKGTILLVDDEEALRRIGAAQLQALGYRVFLAPNGLEAVELYRRHAGEIVLVLLDLIMPVMGGIEAYRELRGLAPDLAIVICSGHGADTFRNEINGDPHAGVLLKPYTQDQLKKMLAVTT